MSTLQKNILTAFFATMGMVCKPILGPFLNIITDFIFIPGGSAVGGISMSFLLLGPILIPNRWTATKMAFLQSILALIMGSSSFQGLFVLISYTIPGVVIDLIMSEKMISILGIKLAMNIAGMSAVVTGAFITNTAFFRLDWIPFTLFILVASISGVLGSYIAYNIYIKFLENNKWRNLI